ncbi:hypothetical protein [Campylobacter concisus]|uniref:hypothetical protein n=1 Tax=Campylobacter concisus TaxID=199 RepID=UPI000CD96867|nr:hypothetical protein [Campylobacter concisus]
MPPPPFFNIKSSFTDEFKGKMTYTSFYLVALNLSTKTAQPQCSRPIKASILCLFEVAKIVSVAYKFSSGLKFSTK